MIDRNDTPELDDARYVLPIVRPEPMKGITGIVIAKQWVGRNVHWNGKRNVSCLGSDDCKHCERWKPQWVGFLPLQGRRSNRVMLVQFTKNCYPQMKALFDDKESMLGWVIRFQRLGQRKNSPLQADVLGREFVKEELSMSNLHGCVERIFQESAKRPIQGRLI